MCACHKLDFYSLVQRQTERSLLSFQSTPIPHSHHFFAAWLIMKKQKPCLMIDIFFSAFLRFRFWQLWLLELQLNVVQSCALIMDHHYVKSRLFLQFFDFRTTSGGYDKYQLLVWFNYVEIKNLFKVGSRQCFQRKSPLSSRKSFSHFYFTPNYPARPLLTPLNFSFHNLTSTQWGNLLNVQSSRPCWLVASMPGILDF